MPVGVGERRARVATSKRATMLCASNSLAARKYGLYRSGAFANGKPSCELAKGTFVRPFDGPVYEAKQQLCARARLMSSMHTLDARPTGRGPEPGAFFCSRATPCRHCAC